MKSTWKQFIAINGASLLLSLTTVWAGQAAQPPAPSNQKTAPLPTAESAEAKRNRKQAYLRYIEAQRMKSLQPTKLGDLVTIYKEIIQLDPTAADPHADLSEIYLYLRQIDAMEREAKEAIRLDPDCLNGQKWLARLYLILVRSEKDAKPEQIDRAIRTYEEVARIDSTNAEAWAFLAPSWWKRRRRICGARDQSQSY